MNTGYVVWLDASDRRASMAGAFGSAGDWLRNNEATLQGCSAVLMHWSNSGLDQTDEDLSAGSFDSKVFPDIPARDAQQLPELRRRLLSLRAALADITTGFPRLVVYRGEPTRPPMFLAKMRERFPNFPQTQLFVVKDTVDRTGSIEDCRRVLQPFVGPGNPVPPDPRQAEWKTVVRLVGEAVAWLEATSGEALAPELAAVTERLRQETGERGERLVGRLAAMAEAAGKATASGRPLDAWLQTELGEDFPDERIAAWRKSGLLPEKGGEPQ